MPDHAMLNSRGLPDYLYVELILIASWVELLACGLLWVRFSALLLQKLFGTHWVQKGFPRSLMMTNGDHLIRKQRNKLNIKEADMNQLEISEPKVSHIIPSCQHLLDSSFGNLLPPLRGLREIITRFSREKFEPGPGFEPRISRSLVWRS